jgi:2,3,4,5-tetrahydropyridine-2-carboxylate N-succinyltransferase
VIKELQQRIEGLWKQETSDTSAVYDAMEKLNNGELRIAEKVDGFWKINDYLKKAILLYFKFVKPRIIAGGYFDKVPLKTYDWDETRFQEAGFRMVPGSIVRYSAYIEKSAVLMPSFVNVGAFIGEKTMIDSHVTVGSCAQIGEECHISDGVTLGGVLEPLQSAPVIIEDNCFIGARSAILEGVLVEEGAVLAAGTILSATTKILNRETGEISFGKIPSRAVVVPGTYPSRNVNLHCAVIIKRVDAQTRQKTDINELLRL